MPAREQTNEDAIRSRIQEIVDGVGVDGALDRDAFVDRLAESFEGFIVARETEPSIGEAGQSALPLAPKNGSTRVAGDVFPDETVSLPSDEVDGVGPTIVQSPSEQKSNRGRLRDFGDYELLNEVARGGMGVVYKARQKSLNRIVALKMILAGELAGEQEIKRFKSEAEAAALLDHSGIVPIFEIGESLGQHYFSMGFVEGQSLADRLRDGPLPPREAAEMLVKICVAVAYAHDKGVVHRDLKPGNVLIAESGIPRVTDFGLAKHVDGDSELTKTGQVLGTPSYMPPEQASGNVDEIGPLSDVYSLGAIFYCMLTGRPPFQAATAVDTVMQVLNQDPVSPRTLNTQLPKDLDTICLKCLNKDSQSRYGSVGELAADVRRHLAGEPIVARPTPRVERIWKWCKRNPRVAGFSALTAALLISMVVGGAYIYRATDARRLVKGLLQAETSEVPSILSDLERYPVLSRSHLTTAYAESDDGSNAKLHAALAMLPKDDSVLPYLKERLLAVSPAQFEPVRNLLESHKNDLTVDYRKIAQDSRQGAARRFQAACALAAYNPESELWRDKQFCEFVADHLTRVLPSELLPWRNALRGVKGHLTDPLAAIYRNRDAGEQVRAFATDTLADYLSDDADGLYDLAADADQKQFPFILEKLTAHKVRVIELGNAEISRAVPEDASEEGREVLAMRQANAAVILLRMESADQIWPLLRHSPDPRVRSYIIHRLSPLGVDPNMIIARYRQESDVTIKRALLLCLGEFYHSQLSKQDPASLIETLLSVYQSDPDPGLHGAAEWLLRKWGQAEQIARIDKALRQNEEQIRESADSPRQWYINGQGQTFAILDAGEFQMGSPESAPSRSSMEDRHQRQIGRRLAISTKEVTKAQWRIFNMSANVWSADDKRLHPFVRTDDSPMVGMTWYEAARYCNWLSKQEGIAKDQWCYQPNEELGYSAGMKAKERFWELTGYRLPTEAEWEFACRAGATCSRYYGQSETLLPWYAWYQANDEEHTWPVGSLKPNDFGLFDIQGNVSEWCYDAFDDYPWDSAEPVDDAPDTDAVEDSVRRVLRGGTYGYPARNIRAAFRNYSLPVNRTYKYGFRPVRTYHSYAVARLQRAHELTQAEAFDEAIQQYRVSIEELPIAGAHYGLAKALRKAGKFDESRVQHQIVLQLLSEKVGDEILQKPESLDGVRFSIAQVYMSLARLETDAGDREAETAVWEQVVDLLEKKPDPEDPVYWGIIGQGLYRVGRVAESRQAIEKTIALRGETEPTIRGGPRWWYLTMALGQVGEAKKAWQYYERLVEEVEANPSEAMLRYRAEAAEILGENP